MTTTSARTETSSTETSYTETDRRRERRERQREQNTRPIMEQVTYQAPRFDLIDGVAIQRIHDQSMRILRELGIAFYHEEVLGIFKAHGAKVVGDMVYLDEELVMKYVQMAPNQFTQLARNPANNVTIGGNRAVYAPVYGPPFVVDLERGRREAKLEDFHNFVKMTYLTPYLHHSGGTVVEPTDEPVAALCERLQIRCFRGDEQDVLGRFVGAAHAGRADIVVRLTADCPMHDPDVIDAAVALFMQGGYDHVSNAVRRTFPDGLDVEVMSLEVLECADREARHPFLREHVTTYIRRSKPELGAGDFRLGHLLNDIDLSALRWTVDHAEDLNRVRRFFAALPPDFSWRQALARHDELA